MEDASLGSRNVLEGVLALGNTVERAMPLTTPATPSALIVAHPGHQVRIHGWLESVRPRVFILTDGSGRSGRPRLGSTTEYLAELGLRTGTIYGRFTERAIYQAMLRHDVDLFIGLADELAEAIVREQIECVVGDATEGFNSTHDVCRLLINAAVEMATRSNSRRIANFDFPVIQRPDSCPEPLRPDAIWLHLDEDVFQRKLAVARKYYPGLIAELEAALDGTEEGPLRTYIELCGEGAAATKYTGLDMFRVECLRPVAGGDERHPFWPHPPFYERHAEKLVAAGHYERVIRYREHILPLAEALWNHVERGA